MHTRYTVFEFPRAKASFPTTGHPKVTRMLGFTTRWLMHHSDQEPLIQRHDIPEEPLMHLDIILMEQRNQIPIQIGPPIDGFIRPTKANDRGIVVGKDANLHPILVKPLETLDDPMRYDDRAIPIVGIHGFTQDREVKEVQDHMLFFH
jgi:hypothetical protein